MADTAFVTSDGGTTTVNEASVEEFGGKLRGTLIRPSDEGYDEARRSSGASSEER